MTAKNITIQVMERIRGITKEESSTRTIPSITVMMVAPYLALLGIVSLKYNVYAQQCGLCNMQHMVATNDNLRPTPTGLIERSDKLETSWGGAALTDQRLFPK